MRLRLLPIPLLLGLLFVLFVPTAQAQSDDGTLVLNVAGISDGCGDTMSADECMASGGTTYTFCTNEACPACGFNQAMTASVCYRLFGNYGYCTCTPGGVARDKNGQLMPNCSTSGSCVQRR